MLLGARRHVPLLRLDRAAHALCERVGGGVGGGDDGVGGGCGGDGDGDYGGGSWWWRSWRRGWSCTFEQVDVKRYVLNPRGSEEGHVLITDVLLRKVRHGGSVDRAPLFQRCRLLLPLRFLLRRFGRLGRRRRLCCCIRFRFRLRRLRLHFRLRLCRCLRRCFGVGLLFLNFRRRRLHRGRVERGLCPLLRLLLCWSGAAPSHKARKVRRVEVFG
mmetsp:Transcript_77255/g.222241  ORF Transcript_77255/g.222241 Transcript_77255/m.222241 type:complete len:215 (-) Transcript_77255:198-842(-)